MLQIIAKHPKYFLYDCNSDGYAICSIATKKSYPTSCFQLNGCKERKSKDWSNSGQGKEIAIIVRNRSTKSKFI